MRAKIGAQLSRKLKTIQAGVQNLKARAASLLHALEKIDRLVARFVRRMRNGLSRRVSRHTRPLPVSRRFRAALMPLLDIAPVWLREGGRTHLPNADSALCQVCAVI